MSRSALEAAIRGRDYAEALVLSRRLRDPARPDPDLDAMHGHVLAQLGLHAEAREVLLPCTRSRPHLPSVWIDLTQAAIGLGDWPAAAQAIARFRQLAPNASAGVFAQARIAFALGQSDEAERLFLQAARAHPAWIDRRFALGNEAFDAGQFAVAARHYRACLRDRPDGIDARLNLISSLTHLGEHADALALARTGNAKFPDDVRLLQRYSQLLDLQPSADEERLDVRRRWVALAADSASAQLAYANALTAIGENAQAHEHYAIAMRLDPQALQARWTAMHLPRQSIFADEAEIQSFARQWRDDLSFFESLDQTPDADTCRRLIATCTNFSLAYVGEDMRSDYERYGRLLTRFCDQALSAAATPAARPPRRDRRRRVGVVSAHFHWHSVSRVWRDLILPLDREQVELACFHLGSADDDSVAAWRGRADHFVDAPRDLHAWHHALLEAALDVVIFLDLGMHPLSQVLASQRYAPVQCTTSAHPMTSGMPRVDYFLSSDLAEPADAQAHYSEQLVRLPGLAWAYQPSTAAASGPPVGQYAERGGIGFYCAQNGVKLLPVHDALFARILAGAPDSVLALTPGMNSGASARLHGRMRIAFETAGVDLVQRVQTFNDLAFDTYRGLLAHTDVMLDTLLFSGGLTSMDALSMDIPIVTLPGRLLRSRQTMAMLRLLELDALIARDADDYIAIALRLAHDHDWRAEVRAVIRDRKHRLYATSDALGGLQAFLLRDHPPR